MDGVDFNTTVRINELTTAICLRRLGEKRSLVPYLECIILRLWEAFG